MEHRTGMIESLVEEADEYCQTRIDLLTLKAVYQSSDMISSLVSQLAVLLVGLVALLIFNMGLAFLVGAWLGRVYYGFFTVAVCDAIVGVLLYRYRRVWIKIPLNNSIISHELN